MLVLNVVYVVHRSSGNNDFRPPHKNTPFSLESEEIAGGGGMRTQIKDEKWVSGGEICMHPFYSSVKYCCT